MCESPLAAEFPFTGAGTRWDAAQKATIAEYRKGKTTEPGARQRYYEPSESKERNTCEKSERNLCLVRNCGAHHERKAKPGKDPGEEGFAQFQIAPQDPEFYPVPISRGIPYRKDSLKITLA